MGIAIYTRDAKLGIVQERGFYLFKIEFAYKLYVDSIACPFNYPMEP